MKYILAVLCISMNVSALEFDALDAKLGDNGKSVHINGGHFNLVINADKGGLIDKLSLYDGLNWNSVIDEDVKAFPVINVSKGGSRYEMADGEIVNINKHNGDVFVITKAQLYEDIEHISLELRIVYQICPEGAIFIDFFISNKGKSAGIDYASVGFEINEDIVAGDYFRDDNISKESLLKARPSVRAAYGRKPAVSFTNEIEVVLQDSANIAGKGGFRKDKGVYEWLIADGAVALPTGYFYHNIIGIGLGAAVRSSSKSNIIGQPIYHWINFAAQPGEIISSAAKYHNGMSREQAKECLEEIVGAGADYWISDEPRTLNRVLDVIQKNAQDCDRAKAMEILNAITDQRSWYPSDSEIDAMAQKYGSILLLHHEWMRQRGSNGNPHADYNIARDEDELVRTVSKAHKAGMKVGLYMRGIEDYGLAAKFFEKYLIKDYDGIYVDWHGFTGRAVHESLQPVEVKSFDMHYSADGSYLPAKQYMDFTRRLRSIVGGKGFLIGHLGSMNSGVLANLGWDGDTCGEAVSTREMFSKDVQEAVYAGMLAGNITTAWPEESEDFRNKMGAAKMAGWGVYPQILMGFGYDGKRGVFSKNAAAQDNGWVWEYWRILSQFDMSDIEILNSPADAERVFECDSENIAAIAYRQKDGQILMIISNISGSIGQNITIKLDGSISSISLEKNIPADININYDRQLNSLHIESIDKYTILGCFFKVSEKDKDR